LIVDTIVDICKMTPFQFRFHQGFGGFKALESFCTILKGSGKAYEFLSIGAFDMNAAFGSLIHFHTVLELFNRGAPPDMVVH